MSKQRATHLVPISWQIKKKYTTTTSLPPLQELHGVSVYLCVCVCIRVRVRVRIYPKRFFFLSM